MLNSAVSVIILLSEAGLFAWYLSDVPRRKSFFRPPAYFAGIAAVAVLWYFVRSVLSDDSFVFVFFLLFAAIGLLQEISLAAAFYLSSVFTTFVYTAGIVSINSLMQLHVLDSGLGMDYARQPLLILGELAAFALKVLSVGIFKRLIPEILRVKLNRIQLLNAFLPVCAAYYLSKGPLSSAAGAVSSSIGVKYVILLGLFIYASTAGAALAVHYQSRDTENIEIQNRMKAQFERYEKSKEQEDSIRKLNHDMKNHLLVIDSMQDVGQIHAYAEELLGNIRSTKHVAYTGNIIVDSLINSKQQQIQEHQIVLKVIADLTGLKRIEDIDLCAIFGNALDNAIEAVRNLPDPEKRIITIKAYVQSGMWVIEISNYFSGALTEENGQLKSTHGGFRGIGMNSIRYALKKYEGTLSYETNADLFVLQLIFPEQI